MSKRTDKAVSRAAATMGRKGGKAKVPKGLAKMSPERRSELGRKGAAERWKRHREALAREEEKRRRKATDIIEEILKKVVDKG